MDEDGVRCGVVRRPCMVRDSAYARVGGLDRDGSRAERKKPVVLGAEERQRRERVVVARRGVGGEVGGGGRGWVRRHSSPRHARWPTGRTSRPARGGARARLSSPVGRSTPRAPPLPPPLSMRERRKRLVPRWWRRHPGTARHGKQPRARDRSRPMPTLGPGPATPRTGRTRWPLPPSVPCAVVTAVPLGAARPFTLFPAPARRGATLRGDLLRAKRCGGRAGGFIGLRSCPCSLDVTRAHTHTQRRRCGWRGGYDPG